MRAILLDGSHAGDDTGERVGAALARELEASDWQVEHLVLREKKLGPCAGDFFCWVRTPGVCNLSDDNRAIARSIIGSDLMVYLTPVTFGGYSSALKRMVDHQLQNILPFFMRIDGQTHHQKRYTKCPDLLAIGWMDESDEKQAAIFRQLVRRNAVNLHADRSFSAVMRTGWSDSKIHDAVPTWLQDVRGSRGPVGSEPEPLRGAIAEPPPTEDVAAPGIQRALLLVGSPRTRKSTSYSLGGYLFEQLEARGVSTKTIFLHTIVRSREKMTALFQAMDAADLAVLAFPLYIDSLPAPVIEALERIAARRRDQPPDRRQLFAAISNCGFPEAAHNVTALAICETFAQQAGFAWAGSLALGGGEGLVSARPLVELGGRGQAMRTALDLAAVALAQGQTIPATAQERLTQGSGPAWFYRLAGNVGWRFKARRYAASRQLRRQPYTAGRL